MKNKLLLIAHFLMVGSFGVLAQSTSPNPQPEYQIKDEQKALPVNSSQVITFSEYRIGTTITNQYKNIGVLFEGGTFITTDASNPTSPVLSGSPRFEGPITGRFVTPGTEKQAVVKSFTFDAGYFDNLTSTRVEWFDSDGKKLGQKINSKLGIEQITVEGGDIAYFTINVVADEPAGYAIDNISFVPIGSSIVFRESENDKLRGVWGLLGDEIPGFDHTALFTDGKVFESIPPYKPGLYVSEDGKEKRFITQINGVQSQHSLGTFKYDAIEGEKSNVSETDEIPISEDLAVKMRTAIESVNGATYHHPVFGPINSIIASLLPAVQKGSNNEFTCVGLIEWAAEQAGHNNGQGFIRNDLEAITIKEAVIPLLSPQLLNYTLKYQQLVANGKQWVQGLLDPVDFIVTDPLGRRLGYIQGVGLFKEIPYAFYPGDGKTEQFLIPQTIPGTYKITLSGKGEYAFAGFGSKESSESFGGMLAQGETLEKTIVVKPTVGCLGDVNLDGAVDTKDITALSKKLNQFTNGLGDPGDLDGDGLLSTVDVELLKKLVGVLETPLISISPVSPATVCTGAPVSLTATPSSFTATNYIWSSIPAGFSGAGASLTVFTQNAPVVSVSTTYIISVTAINGPSSVSASVNLTVNPCQVGQFRLITPEYNCQTGSFVFKTSGGDGSPIEYFAIGITGWTTNPNQFVDQGLRTAADAKPLTLLARQNGVEVSTSFDIRALCDNQGARLGSKLSPELSLDVKVLGNPLTGQQFEVVVRGAQGQPLSIQLVNQTGQVVADHHLPMAQAEEQVRMSIGNHPVGLFILRVNTPTQNKMVKVIKGE